MTVALKLTPHAWPDPKTIPARQFLYGHDYIRGFISATVAPGGAAKTALTITEALAMASGRDLLHLDPKGRAPKIEPLNICLWNLEDDADEMARRLAAAQLHFGPLIAKTGYRERLFMKSAETPLLLAGEVGGQFVMNDPLIGKLIAGLRKSRIDVLIVDPFVSSHGVYENDNDLIDKVVKEGWARIAREANCSVMVVHHVRKGPAGPAREVGIEDSRGAGALINAVRMGRVINRLSKDEAPKLGIEPDSAWRYIRVDPGKANLAPPSVATWRRLESVTLGNAPFVDGEGDVIGVVEGWTPPTQDQRGKTSQSERDAIVEAMAGQLWRESDRAQEWVGHAVADALGLSASDKVHKAQINAKIKAAIADGWMVQCQGRDKNRELRSMIKAKRGPRSKASLLGEVPH